MRTSSIFRSRWMALVWAAGILWFAYDVAGSPKSANDASAEQATDATRAPITDDQQKQLEAAINGL